MSGIGLHGQTLVSDGTGYGLLIGLGVAFCGVILIAVQIQKAYLSEDSSSSEMFMVANRSVGTGLTASAVFSSWMWINETVLATAMCYRYGLSVPFLWSTCLCFQIVLMSCLGVLSKIRVPYAHTSLEIIRMRYGKVGHLVFIVLNLVNNVFSCASMILTGSQLIHGISGVHFVAAVILIPLGVVMYTAVGGLKATFLTDFLHTTIALVLIIYFTLATLTSPHIGGLGGLYDKVTATAAQNTIAGNYKGSLLTMKSYSGIIWAVILRVNNTATVLMDTAYWQKSFATEVKSTVPGYNLAALAIFGIPWGLGTVLGLSARALHLTPIWPTYPNDMSLREVTAGFVMPYLIKAVIGDHGVVAFFVLVFMALTSTISSSLIAVSSILSFDIYKTYLKPKANNRNLIGVSHLTVVLFAVFITGISIALNYGGADMTWLNYFRPVVSCPGVIPLALSLCWSRQTKLAATLAPVLGFFTGLGCWLGVAKHLYGEISMATTEASLPALAGALGSFLSPAIYSVLISLFIKPSTFDWREFLRIELIDQEYLYADDATPNDDSRGTQVPNTTDSDGAATPNDPEKPKVAVVSRPRPSVRRAEELSLDDVQHPLSEETLKELRWWYRFTWILFIVVLLVTWVAWPMPLYRNYVFTRTFFASWTSVAIAWQFVAFFTVIIFPLYDGRHAVAKGARGVYRSTHRLFQTVRRSKAQEASPRHAAST